MVSTRMNRLTCFGNAYPALPVNYSEIEAIPENHSSWDVNLMSTPNGARAVVTEVPSSFAKNLWGRWR